MIRRIAVLSLDAIAAVAITAGAPAAHAEAMSTSELQTFLIGRTYYLDVTAGGTLATSGQAILYFAQDGLVLNRVPNGRIQQGNWVIKDGTVCVTWKDQPPNPCSRYEKGDAGISVINVATGQARGRIAKSANGNAENLKP